MSMVDAPAYDSGHSFAKIAIPYTIYLSLNLLEFYVRIQQSASSCGLASWMYLSTIYYIYDASVSFLSIKLKNPYTVD